MTDDAIDFIAGVFISLLAWFFGGLDGYLKVLVAFMVIDYIFGLCAAFMKGIISSKTGFNGIIKKCVMLTFVGIANLLDKYLIGSFTGGSEVMRSAVCLFYIANEGISIIENADKLNIPIPKFLRDRFLEIKENRIKKKSNK